MFVKSIMKPKHKCIVSSPNESLHQLITKLEENDVQGAPVVDKDGQFIGMISKQMIYRAYFKNEDPLSKEEFLENTKTLEIVDFKELHITEDDVFEKTLPTFKGFPILAVVNNNGKFLGLVTRFDVIEQFESAFGLKRKGIRIAFTSEESEGRIARLADIIDHYHENVISLATFDETDKLARRIVLKIEKKNNVDKFAKKLEKSGFRVLDIKEI